MFKRTSSRKIAEPSKPDDAHKQRNRRGSNHQHQQPHHYEANKNILEQEAEARKRLEKNDPSVLDFLFQLAKNPTSRPALIEDVAPAIELGPNYPLGSKERESLLGFLKCMAHGVSEKDRTGDLQGQVFDVGAKFLVTELRDEAADGICKELATESLRGLARNYSLKPRLFELDGFMPALFTTIKQHTTPTTHKWASIMLITLSSDASVAEGYANYYSKEIKEVLRILWTETPTTKWNEKLENIGHAVRLSQNLSQHEIWKGPLASNEFAIEQLAKAAKREPEALFEEVVMQAIMALANLVGEDESKTTLLQGAQGGLLRLVKLLEEVMEGKEIHFTLEPVLRALRSLCPVDANRQALTSGLLQTLPDVLLRALEQQDRVSCELAFGILSQLSFDADTLHALKDDKRVKDALDQIIQLSTSEDSAMASKWVKVARASATLRFNLQKKEDIARRVSARNLLISATSDRIISAETQEQEPLKLMISYQWKYQETAKLLALLLKQRPNVNVWIDIQKMKAEVMQSMADAVSSSDYVLILISDTYKNSSACKCEAMYAFELRKNIIPIVVEKDYVAAGWLGALIAGKMRYDCSDQSKLNQVLPHILTEIQPNSQMDSVGFSSSAFGPRTVEEVAQWLKENGLGQYAEAFIREQVDGELLQMLRDDFACFTSDLQTVFGMDFKARVMFRRCLAKV